MQFKGIIIAAVAVLCCSGAMAQKAKKTKKSNKKAVSAAQLTPALKSYSSTDFSYALGVAQGESLKQFMQQQLGVDTAYFADAMQAMTANLSEAEQKRITAQAAGIKIAEINKRNLPMISAQAAGKGDSTYVNQTLFEKALTEVVTGKATSISRDSALKVVDGQFNYQKETYKEANIAFLRTNAAAKGIKVTPSGLQYQIVTAGNGPVATDSTEVEVHYEGSLIDGTVFDSSYKRGKPSTFRPDQVIKGWKEALTMMPEGSLWKLYIPSELGYGERAQGQNIPGNSTLIFTVEVVKVKTAAAADKKK